jgi:RNA polymerase sigma-70 factor (ECF subfamily)
LSFGYIAIPSILPAPSDDDEPLVLDRHQSSGASSGGRTIAARLDPTIVERARRGDLEAFESIVRDRIGTVYRLTLAIVGNEADATDATQEAFIAAWRQVRGLRDPERVDAWLARIAVNAARMLARGRRRRAVREIPGLATLETSPVPLGDPAGRRADDARSLGVALGRLTAEQRAILALRHLEGRDIAEIAAALGIRPGTAKSRLFTARRALAAALAREDRP